MLGLGLRVQAGVLAARVGYEIGIGCWTAQEGEGNGTPLQYSCLENPMDEEPGGLQSMGLLRVGHD